MYRRQRKALVVGHIIRICDYTNYYGLPWLLQDLLALFLELLSAGYPSALLNEAVTHAIRSNPSLEEHFEPIQGVLNRLLCNPIDGLSVTERSLWGIGPDSDYEIRMREDLARMKWLRIDCLVHDRLSS